MPCLDVLHRMADRPLSTSRVADVVDLLRYVPPRLLLPHRLFHVLLYVPLRRVQHLWRSPKPLLCTPTAVCRAAATAGCRLPLLLPLLLLPAMAQ